MRKLFLGTIITSLFGALIVGAALAWTGSVAGNATAASGQVAINFNQYVSTANKVVPSGLPILVATSGFSNLGDIAVMPNGATPGSVLITSTSNGGCTAGNFDPGSVTVGGNSGLVNPGNNSGADAFHVNLTMQTGAPDACQNVTINYSVTLNVTT